MHAAYLFQGSEGKYGGSPQPHLLCDGTRTIDDERIAGEWVEIKWLRNNILHVRNRGVILVFSSGSNLLTAEVDERGVGVRKTTAYKWKRAPTDRPSKP
jgi:hypothetical protein